MESTRDDVRGAHEGEGRAPGGQAHPGPSWPLRKEVGALLSPQEIQYPDTNRVKISAQSELRISENIRNAERPESGTQKQRETDPILEAMEANDQRGNPSPI